MSIPHSSKREPAYQPFQCLICQSRFTRHENLKRHAALHSRSQEEASLPCDFCQASFSRPDLRHRHMKRKHPDQDSEQRRATKGSRRRQSKTISEIDRWRSFGENGHSVSPSERQDLRPQNILVGASSSADENAVQPSSRDLATIDGIVQDATDLERSLLLETSLFNPTEFTGDRLNMTNSSQSAPYDTSLNSFSFPENIPDGLLLNALEPSQNDWYPSNLQITRGCDLFFTHISPFLPFLHQPTFNATLAAPHLIISMLSLAYQYGEDPDYGDRLGSGVNLSTRCFHQARALLPSDEGNMGGFSHNLTLVQSYLLLQICAMMYLCGQDSAYGLKMHSNMIPLARASGMQPVSSTSSTTEDLDSLWREFIKSESHKRTLFAVHQVDTLWYQFLSIPRSISHLEIKHDLPCPESHWAASTSAEWAHRRLIAGNTSPPMQYANAVRLFLSPSSNTNLSSIPAFDPYGAINIAQFLISSAREISGWSTMTGMLSMERFEALRSSLAALRPFLHSQSDEPTPTRNTCEATWETAMIELQIWSPSHTGGIVEGSINAVLNQATSLAPSYEFLSDPSTANAIQPHVDWFLHYLDTTVNPDTEAPWIAVYAYKAFLIAWQLIRGGVPGAMQVVGVHDSDTEEGLRWARKVFQRRQRWEIGRLIMFCLDQLGKQAGLQ
ncbi:hypothetical protein PHISCL_07166 [Aspergillus sclerotialis]|uniref:C2H2-type domain-containing protein n=1 Tax=Aspergillus sclerotialis TaxID=2070753 RepID=A0A3A2ZC32_9EURO|nr:hypothetical protein PHISCL_07166 [Aspergillus sclerotialis]